MYWQTLHLLRIYDIHPTSVTPTHQQAPSEKLTCGCQYSRSAFQLNSRSAFRPFDFPIRSRSNGQRASDFYSASALLAMQSAVLARGILSVCLSVCLSVTFRYCVQRNEDTIVGFPASGRTIPLVSGEVKFIRIFAGDHLQRGR